MCSRRGGRLHGVPRQPSCSLSGAQPRPQRLGDAGAGPEPAALARLARPLADEGEQELTYALLPHTGGLSAVLAEAEDLNRPLLARRATGAGSLRPLRIGGLRVGLGALKVLEDGGGLVLRVYKSQGARGQVTVEPLARWTLDRQLDLLERETGPPDSRLTPFAVRSWRLTT